jgi:exonuclease VII large subunit
MDIDLEPVWHTLGGGAAAAAVFTLLRLGLEYGFRHADRRIDRDERHHGQRQDVEARLERLLHERLNDAERRLERCQLEVDAERERRIVIEREYAVLEQLFLDRLQQLPTAQRLTIDAEAVRRSELPR